MWESQSTRATVRPTSPNNRQATPLSFSASSLTSTWVCLSLRKDWRGNLHRQFHHFGQSDWFFNEDRAASIAYIRYDHSGFKTKPIFQIVPEDIPDYDRCPYSPLKLFFPSISWHIFSPELNCFCTPLTKDQRKVLDSPLYPYFLPWIPN